MCDKETELTYEDIYDDFREQFPIFIPLVSSYAPAIDLYRTIVIWTDHTVYHYSYDTKELRRVDRVKGE